MPEDHRDDADCSDLVPADYFQTMDRVHVASQYLQHVFEDDAVLAAHPELLALYDQAVTSLETLYQAVGQLDKTWEP